MIKRYDLSNRVLVACAVAGTGAIAFYFAVVYRLLPDAWRSPGSVELYFTGLAGGLLLLTPVLFMLVKRTGHGDAAPSWFVAHVLASFTGTLLIAVHTGGHLTRAPALLFALLLALLALGFWSRIRGSRELSGIFGTRKTAFSPAGEAPRRQIASLVREKHQVLAQLDSSAKEATFSVTLAHWVRSPLLSCKYARLARIERQLIGTAGALGAPKTTLIRRIHIALAACFVVGLLTHVVIVTFFASYASRGEPVTWWHLSK